MYFCDTVVQVLLALVTHWVVTLLESSYGDSWRPVWHTAAGRLAAGTGLDRGYQIPTVSLPFGAANAPGVSSTRPDYSLGLQQQPQRRPQPQQQLQAVL
jgi:hypothetical protein